MCNRFVKFHHLHNYVTNVLGMDYLATGHYARLHQSHGSSNPVLVKGVDPIKDQSYFLAMTRAQDLQGVMFPLGQLYKSQVRELAAEGLKGLRVLNKSESMGICFIGKRHLPNFLGQYINLTPGRFC